MVIDLRYFETFLKMSKPPSQQHRDTIQEIVNYQFDNSSTYYTDVEEEIAFGTLNFKTCDVRVNTIVDAKTGQRVNDDYKKLIFRDLEYTPPLGTRYRFSNNIWLTFSTDNIKTDTSSVYVRRCDNTINTQDKYGNIHREPCYVDYKVTETQPFKELRIDVPNGRISVQCQYNNWTKSIKINDRFIFGNNTYRVREFHHFDLLETFDKNSSTILSFYADYDEIAPDDNLELGIANYKSYNYRINVVDSVVGSVGETEKINYHVTLDGKETNEDVLFESSDNAIASVDDCGNYILNSNGDCNIIVRLKNNPNLCSVIPISVVKKVKDNYQDIISPDVRSIRINNTQEYSIFEYNNGIKQDTKFDISCSDMPESNYIFEVDGNNFYITNLKTTENYLLKVTCKNQRTLKETVIYIKLGGLF